jgi:hypothetical protein
LSAENTPTSNRFWNTSPKRLVAVLLILNVVLRGTLLLTMHPPQRADFLWYYQHAREMALGQGYHWHGHATAYWPIGWPFILSILYRITGPSVVAGLLLNTVFSILIVLFLYGFVRRLTGKPIWGFFAALGYTLLPSQVQWNAINGSEESFTLLLLLSLILLTWSRQMAGRRRVSTLALSGFLMGLAADIQPIPLLFPVYLWLLEAWILRAGWLPSLRRAALFAAAMLLGVMPVTVRNAIALHHFVLVSTNGGVNLYQGTMINGGYFWSYNPKINPLLAAGSNEILENKMGEEYAFHYYLTHPWKTIVDGFIKMFDLYKNDVNAVRYTYINSHSPLWLVDTMRWFDSVVYWVIMLIAAAGLTWLIVRRRDMLRRLSAVIAFLIYYTMVFFFFPAWDRFRYPLMPLYAVFLPFAGPLAVRLWSNRSTWAETCRAFLHKRFSQTGREHQ